MWNNYNIPWMKEKIDAQAKERQEAIENGTLESMIHRRSILKWTARIAPTAIIAASYNPLSRYINDKLFGVQASTGSGDIDLKETQRKLESQRDRTNVEAVLNPKYGQELDNIISQIKSVASDYHSAANVVDRNLLELAQGATRQLDLFERALATIDEYVKASLPNVFHLRDAYIASENALKDFDRANSEKVAALVLAKRKKILEGDMRDHKTRYEAALKDLQEKLGPLTHAEQMQDYKRFLDAVSKTHVYQTDSALGLQLSGGKISELINKYVQTRDLNVYNELKAKIAEARAGANGDKGLVDTALAKAKAEMTDGEARINNYLARVEELRKKVGEDDSQYIKRFTEIYLALGKERNTIRRGMPGQDYVTYGSISDQVDARLNGIDNKLEDLYKQMNKDMELKAANQIPAEEPIERPSRNPISPISKGLAIGAIAAAAFGTYEAEKYGSKAYRLGSRIRQVFRGG